MALMLFWTWARGLEDTFDSSNRRNLRHFIHMDEDSSKLTISFKEATSGIVGSEPDEDVITTLPALTDENGDDKKPRVTYYISKGERYQEEPEAVEDRRELVRIPTCAVFHKLTVGKGVPHSFVGECY